MPDIYARMKLKAGMPLFDQQKKEAFSIQLLVAILPTLTQYSYSKAEQHLQTFLQKNKDITGEEFLKYEMQIAQQAHAQIRGHCNALIDGFCQDYFPHLYEKRDATSSTVY